MRDEGLTKRRPGAGAFSTSRSGGWSGPPAPEQGRRDIDAVRTGLGRQVRAGDGGEGGHQVRETDRLVDHRPGLDMPRPAGDERDPVAALPDMGFEPAEAARRRVAVGAGMRTVVAREHNEGPLGRTQPSHGLHDPAHAEIGQRDQVAARPIAAPSLDQLRDEPGRVRGR
ncbi:MAG: hypothetical protein MZV63_58935 [Marinilabiliales bacterium]|nr:hypothetical protein [Marinilabiliales bacterium]